MKLRALMVATIIVAVFILTSTIYAANGDLIVNGNLSVGTSTSAGKAEINGNMVVDGDVTVKRDLTVAGKITAPNVLTRYYESPELAIVSAGGRALAHGLGVKPVLFQCAIICKTAEGGYDVGDETVVDCNLTESGFNRGISLVSDDVDIKIRYGQSANIFYLLNKTTGTAFSISNAKWNFIVRAWSF